MLYAEIFKSVYTFIDKLKEYIHYYNNEKISQKKNEPGTVPNSFASNLIFNFV